MRPGDSTTLASIIAVAEINRPHWVTIEAIDDDQSSLGVLIRARFAWSDYDRMAAVVWIKRIRERMALGVGLRVQWVPDRQISGIASCPMIDILRCPALRDMRWNEDALAVIGDWMEERGEGASSMWQALGAQKAGALLCDMLAIEEDREPFNLDREFEGDFAKQLGLSQADLERYGDPSPAERRRLGSTRR